MNESSCFTAIFVILATNVGIQSLQMFGIDVPSSVMMGDPVWLNCSLDYNEGELYSAKWYKDGDEFYRFLPGEENVANQIFDVPGVYVDLSRSSEAHVYLNTTDNNTDGMYRCEASGESPNFDTIEAVKELTVYALPEEPPTILEASSVYDIGQEVNATCVSSPSKPAAKLSWYINGKQAPKQLLTHKPPIMQNDGLEISSLVLRFEVTPENSPEAQLFNLRCVSTVFEKYSMKSAVLVIGDKKDKFPTTEPPEQLAETNDTTPTISGSLGSYITGDELNINCTSVKASPASHLRWFLNYDKAPANYLVPYPTMMDDDGFETTVLGLRFIVDTHHFDTTDVITLKCSSTLSRVIDTKSVEISIENSKGGVQQWVDNREAGSVKTKTNDAQRTIRATSLVLLTLLPFL